MCAGIRFRWLGTNSLASFIHCSLMAPLAARSEASRHRTWFVMRGFPCTADPAWPSVRDLIFTSMRARMMMLRLRTFWHPAKAPARVSCRTLVRMMLSEP